MKRYESAEMRIIALNNNVIATSGDPRFSDSNVDASVLFAPGRRGYSEDETDF